jgi:hypothetical protein
VKQPYRIFFRTPYSRYEFSTVFLFSRPPPRYFIFPTVSRFRVV